MRPVGHVRGRATGFESDYNPVRRSRFVRVPQIDLQLAIDGCSHHIPGRKAASTLARARLTTRGFGVWDTQASSGLVVQYPDTQAALQEASRAFEHAESNTRQPVSAGGQHGAGRSNQPIAIIVIPVILIGEYLFIHAHKYENCIITPSVLAWPSECL